MTNNQIYSSWHICHELKYGKTTARVICALSFFQTVVNIYTCRLTSVKGVRGWFRIKHALNSIMSMSTCFIFSNPEINLSWPPSRATDPPTRAVFHSVRRSVFFFYFAAHSAQQCESGCDYHHHQLILQWLLIADIQMWTWHRRETFQCPVSGGSYMRCGHEEGAREYLQTALNADMTWRR